MGLDSAVVSGAVVAAVITTVAYLTLTPKQLSDSKIKKLEEKLQEAKAQAAHEKQKCEEQRVGRTRAERELRNFVNKATTQGQGVKEDTTEKGGDKGIQPIGFIESCYRERNGTPRQGNLVTQGRGLLRLKLPLMDASHTLEGLEQYGHVWIIFIFHENTNIMRGIRQDRVSSSVKAKVRPPRLDGIKVGLFSTRTPHRPNAIGLSIAKVERIEGPILHLSGIDLLDGTPVLDVKPYIPLYDSVPDSITPSWIYDPPATPMKCVTFETEAEESLKALVPELRFYTKYEDIRKAIQEVLMLDIRSVRRRKVDKEREAKRKAKGDTQENNNNNEEEEEASGDDTNVIEKHRFAIDVLNVGFTSVEGVANVFKIELDEKLPAKWNTGKN